MSRIRGIWFIPIPYPKRINFGVGPAIDIPCKGKDVSHDTVDKYHQIFLNELEALFERHKTENGYEECHLKII